MGKLSMEARKKERKCQLTREERRRKSYFSAGGETEDLFRMVFSPETLTSRRGRTGQRMIWRCLEPPRELAKWKM
jgi:hypothetical protein